MEQVKKQRKIKHRKCSICSKTVKWEWGNKPTRCPHCNAIHFDKPPMEAKLFNLQEDWLETKNKEVIGKMFPIMKEYARRIVLKNLTGNARYDETKLETVSSDTANKLVEYYLSKENFSIFQSFGFYLDKIAKQNMFAKKLQDRDQIEFSIEEFIENHEDNSTAIDSLEFEAEKQSEDWHQSVDDQINIDYVVNEAEKFVGHIIDRIRQDYGYRMALMQLILLNRFFEGASKKFFKRAYRYKGEEYKEVFEKVKLLFNTFAEDIAKKE